MPSQHADSGCYPAQYGTLWRDQIYTYLHPLELLKLSSTCKFLFKLLNSQPTAFWIALCSRFNIRVASSFEAEAKNVLLSNIIRKCVRNRFEEWKQKNPVEYQNFLKLLNTS